MLYAARQRARRTGVEFSITEADIIIPERCPILGIPLSTGAMEDRESSPSLDRIDNARGYVQGNVIVVSFRANRLKSDASPEELQKLATFYSATRS
jgi:hypothetical protein